MSQSPRPSIALIGAGAAGTSLVLALQRLGYVIQGIASRGLESSERCARLVDCPLATTDAGAVIPQADLVIIATPDGLIQSVCEKLALQPGWRAGQHVIHLSGALDSDALQTARAQGAHVLAMHPVQTFAEPQQGARSLNGAYFALEGDSPALEIGRRLAADLGGHALEIPKDCKPLYHAALCVASNYLVGLTDVAAHMLEQAGVDKASALPLMLSLMQGALDNLRHSGLPQALTGPISRGDADTVRKHLDILQDTAPETLAFYRELGRHTQRVARAKGKQDPIGAETLDKILL